MLVYILAQATLHESKRLTKHISDTMADLSIDGATPMECDIHFADLGVTTVVFTFSHFTSLGGKLHPDQI